MTKRLPFVFCVRRDSKHVNQAGDGPELTATARSSQAGAIPELAGIVPELAATARSSQAGAIPELAATARSTVFFLL